MNRTLSPNEKSSLITRHRKERDGKVRDRIKAVLAYSDGYTYSEIARILLLDDETIRRHIGDYFASNKIAPENGGSQSFLSQFQSKKLIGHLQGFTYFYVKDICNYVKVNFGIKYSVSGMTKWLKANNFSYKKPHVVPAKANAEEQEKFIEFYKKLKEDVSGEPIYFVDSVHPHHQSKPAYGWIFKGFRKKIPTNGRSKHLNIIGGIEVSRHKFCYEEVGKVDADSIALFLTTLRKKHPEKTTINVIWDNAGYHRDGSVQEFAENLGINLHYLPPYSPNLNPIERLWKIMHEHISYNKYYERFSDFKDAIINFLKIIGRRKKLLRSRITDNFTAIDSPLFAS